MDEQLRRTQSIPAVAQSSQASHVLWVFSDAMGLLVFWPPSGTVRAAAWVLMPKCMPQSAAAGCWLWVLLLFL